MDRSTVDMETGTDVGRSIRGVGRRAEWQVLQEMRQERSIPRTHARTAPQQASSSASLSSAIRLPALSVPLTTPRPSKEGIALPSMKSHMRIVLPPALETLAM